MNQINTENRIKGARILSARVGTGSVEKVRPFSGVLNSQSNRREIIQNLYSGMFASKPARLDSAKKFSSMIESHRNENDKPKRSAIKISKQKQQMAQEIMSLKRTINKLLEELAVQKGKVESAKRKNNKYSKVLTTQFEKEIYWGTNTNSSHLVTGIKNMYDNLKQKYDQKCQQFDQAIRHTHFTKELEYIAYVQILEKENKRLNQRFDRMSAANIQILANQVEKQANSYILGELEAENKEIALKYKELHAKYKMAAEGVKDRNQKTQFLQRLIIEKDNNEQAMAKKYKKSEAKLNELKGELDKANKDVELWQFKYQKEISQLRHLFETERLKMKEKHETELERLTDTTKQLQKQNDYLQTIVKDLRATNNELNLLHQSIRNTKSKQASTPKDPTNQNQKGQPIAMPQPVKIVLEQNRAQKKVNLINGKRVPQKANTKHHDNALKKRKVDTLQIADIGELIKYRLLVKGISIEAAKKKFDFNGIESHEADQWIKQYMTMKQVISILTTQPFNLNQENAFILGRYLIEDVNEEYVYCDELNQNLRETVKSIIKNIVNEDINIANHQAIVSSANDILLKYGENLKNVLTINDKSGIISKKKIIDLFTSLGIDASYEVKQYLISKMAVNSSNLSQIDYRLIF